MTSLSPDHVSSTAHTFTSTNPIGSATSRIVSSVTSDRIPDDFFGHETQIEPFCLILLFIIIQIFNELRSRFGEEMNHVQFIRSAFDKRHVCRQRLEQPDVIARSIHGAERSARLNPQFFRQRRTRVSRHDSVPSMHTSQELFTRLTNPRVILSLRSIACSTNHGVRPLRTAARRMRSRNERPTELHHKDQIVFGFFKERRRKRLRSAPFPASFLAIIERNVPFYMCLPEADRRELQGLVQIFLGEKVFEGCGGLELTDEIKVTIAAQACLLLLHRQTDIYPRLITILVYPSAYLAKAVEPIGSGAVLEGDAIHLGESWSSGVVVLSWDDVRAGASDIHDGQNLVLHEFAHQLDREDGAINGTPLLDQRSQYVAWARVLNVEYERLRRDRWLGAQLCSTNTARPIPPSFSPLPPSASLRSPECFRNGILNYMKS